jgi:hypothetical protein
LTAAKLAISDAHKGHKAAVAKSMNATWQRCRVIRCATRSLLAKRNSWFASMPSLG